MAKQTKLSDFFPLPENQDQYPLDFIENKKALKLQESETEIHVGVSDLHDVSLRNELAFFHKKKIKFYEISPQEFAEFLSRKLSDAHDGPSTKDDEKVVLDKLANEGPIVNMVNSILLEGIRLECSDIHIEAYEKKVSVRYRIDGVLKTSRQLEISLFPGIASRIKIMANLNIIERRMPQDGRMSVTMGGQQVEFRVSIIPIQEGESIVLRLFQKRGTIKGLNDLSLSQNYRDALRTISRFPNGLILVTGPTGSGKTTTLNALLSEMNSEKVKIITIEDPVENVIEGIPQVQTNEALGLTFDSILRRLLRHDPDIIMIGEIRDKTTAELAIRSALTGHLVLSTLHTNDALSTIQRLINMGIEPFLLGSVLRGVSAQRLVRRLCPNCKEPKEFSRADKAFLELHDLTLTNQFHGKGCDQCHQTGYHERISIEEIFVMDSIAEELIIRDKSRQEFTDHFKKKKSLFLLDDGLSKVAQGLTSLEEIERAILL